MRVLHVALDDIRGGSARSLRLLHRALIDAGHESSLLLGRTNRTGPDVNVVPPLSLLGRASYHGLNLLGLNYLGIPGSGRLADHPCFRNADVVHFHNLHGGYFNYLALPRLTRAKPAVWTLRDMWAITGHCAHSFDCTRWRSGCGRCPYPKTDPPIRRDATRWEWALKRRVYQRSQVLVTTPSRWLFGRVGESMLGAQPRRHVPNAVDTDAFHPADQRVLRAKLGWPLEATILLFAADVLANPFKHFTLIPTALAGLSPAQRSSLALAIVGEKSWGEKDFGGLRVIPLGRHDDDETMANFYAAADVVLYPTRADNQPRVLLETMACARPCVATDVGGVPELVIHRETGYLARPMDAADFCEGIEWLIGDPRLREQLGAAARQRVEREHSVSRHVSLITEVYMEAIENHGRTLSAL